MNLIVSCRNAVAFFGILVLGAFFAACAAPSASIQDEELTIYAAASLRDVVEELAVAFEARDDARVTSNFAGSNILAQQIRAAPGADLFLSADEDWVRFLEAQGRTVPGSAQPFLRNQLVVIARRDKAGGSNADGSNADGSNADGSNKMPWNDLEPLRGEAFKHLVMADPHAVPAGRYAQAHLEIQAPAIWTEVADRVVPALDVRAALQLVASDPLHVGIVYRTDALASDEVEVLYELPILDQVPIVYWAARIPRGGASPAAERFYAFLKTEAAVEIIGRHGFLPVPSP